MIEQQSSHKMSSLGSFIETNEIDLNEPINLQGKSIFEIEQ